MNSTVHVVPAYTYPSGRVVTVEPSVMDDGVYLATGSSAAEFGSDRDGFSGHLSVEEGRTLAEAILAVVGPRPEPKAVTEQTVMAALLALPMTPAGVAALFEGQGITGTPDKPCACPLANYLSAEFGGADASVYYLAAVRDASDTWRTVNTLPHLVEFAQRFDRGDFPALVRA
jgi:hypothetical protein